MRAAFLGVLGLVCVVATAQGQLDSALPAPFTQHLWTVSGVVNNGLVTVFPCTNASDSTVTVGVEVFGPAGTSLNDPTTTAIAVPPGSTVIFGTKAAAGFSVDAALNVGILHAGSARILATNKGIICNAILADWQSVPPSSMANLAIIKRWAYNVARLGRRPNAQTQASDCCLADCVSRA